MVFIIEIIFESFYLGMNGDFIYREKFIFWSMFFFQLWVRKERSKRFRGNDSQNWICIFFFIFSHGSPQLNSDDQVEAMRLISPFLEFSAGVLRVAGSRVLEFILVSILAHVTVIEELTAVFAVSRVRGSRWRFPRRHRWRLKKYVLLISKIILFFSRRIYCYRNHTLVYIQVIN